MCRSRGPVPARNRAQAERYAGRHACSALAAPDRRSRSPVVRARQRKRIRRERARPQQHTPAIRGRRERHGTAVSHERHRQSGRLTTRVLRYGETKGQQQIRQQPLRAPRFRCHPRPHGGELCLRCGSLDGGRIHPRPRRAVARTKRVRSQAHPLGARPQVRGLVRRAGAAQRAWRCRSHVSPTLRGRERFAGLALSHGRACAQACRRRCGNRGVVCAGLANRSTPAALALFGLFRDVRASLGRGGHGSLQLCDYIRHLPRR